MNATLLIAAYTALGALGALLRADTDDCQVPEHDPNCCAVYIQDLLESFAEADPNLAYASGVEAETGTTEAGTPIWTEPPHPQVDNEVFQALGFAYFPGGRGYGQFARADNSASGHMVVVQARQKQLEIVFELVYRWRTMNSANGVSLEALRTLTMTRTDTDIYTNHADLAVQARRTLGQIRLSNQRFDEISQLTVALALRDEQIGPLVSRLKKLLSDLESLYGLLAAQNNSLSIAMGLGSIDRSQDRPIYYETLNFAAHRLPHSRN